MSLRQKIKEPCAKSLFCLRELFSHSELLVISVRPSCTLQLVAKEWNMLEGHFLFHVIAKNHIFDLMYSFTTESKRKVCYGRRMLSEGAVFIETRLSRNLSSEAVFGESELSSEGNNYGPECATNSLFFPK